jgi:hypothetical protein
MAVTTNKAARSWRMMRDVQGKGRAVAVGRTVIMICHPKLVPRFPDSP